jgi:hypothetical protein
MRARKIAGVVCSSGVLVMAAALLAAQAPKPAASQLFMANFVTVKPGMGPEFTTLQVNEIIPAMKKAGGPGRQAWSSGVFSEAGGFAFFAPVADMAQFDKDPPLRQVLGEQGAAALNAKTAQLTESRRTMLVRTRPDLSYEPNPGGAPAALALVTEVDVVPGRKMDFEAFLKKEVLPAMQQAKVKSYSVLEVVYGDSINAYMTAVGYDDYASMGKGHPFQVALGEEGARKLEAKVGGIIAHVSRFVVRYRADLSIPSAKPSSN